MFRLRNCELLEENNRLRTELEHARQNLILVQSAANDPRMMGKMLEEMTRVVVGATRRAALTGPGALGTTTAVFAEGEEAEEGEKEEAQSADDAATPVQVRDAGAEFAAELAAFPKLPGAAAFAAPRVETAPSEPAPATCVFST